MSIKKSARQMKADETKSILTTTALELFHEYGFDRVTVDDICERAGLTKGAFYHNFESKEDLVVLSFNQQLDEHISGNFVLDEASPLLDQLTGLYMSILDFAHSRGKAETRRSYLAQICACVHLKIPGRAYVDYLTALVERGRREKAFRVELEPYEMYMLLTGTFTGLLMEWSTHDDGPGIPDWKKLMRVQMALLVG